MSSAFKTTVLFSAVLLHLSLPHSALAQISSVEKEWLTQAESRCARGPHKILYKDDIKWKATFPEAKGRYESIYASGKRLLKHIYYSPTERSFFGKSPMTVGEVRVPEIFILSIKRHIETALKLDYAQWIFFSDMGHNHFFLPQKDYDDIVSLPRESMLEAMLGLPELKVLYHTMEQIMAKDANGRVLEDSWTQWRYYTRNLVGDNLGQGVLEVHKNLKDNYNTVREYADYRYWGAGVYISASRDGCFSFQQNGETQYFDVSFFDLPYKGTLDEVGAKHNHSQQLSLKIH